MINLKQDALTAGYGIELNAATISSFGLLFGGSRTTPPGTQDLYFRNGWGVTQNLNLTSGRVELILDVTTASIWRTAS